MAQVTVEVDVDVDLDEFQTEDLLDEIWERFEKAKSSDFEDIKQFANDVIDSDKEENDEYYGMVQSLNDEMKLEFIKKHFNELNLNDLEKLIQKK